MKLWNKLKNFVRAGSEHYEETNPLIKKIRDKQEDYNERYNNPTCDYCGGQILHYEKRKTIAGKKHHVVCLRKLRKQAKKQAFS